MMKKKTIMIFAIALTMAACGTQSTKENAKEMNTLTFTTEQAKSRKPYRNSMPTRDSHVL